MSKLLKNILTGFAFVVCLFMCSSCNPPKISADNIDGVYCDNTYYYYSNEIGIANKEGTVMRCDNYDVNNTNYRDYKVAMSVARDNDVPYLIEIKNTGNLRWSCQIVAYDYYDYSNSTYYYEYYPATITISSDYSKDGMLTITWTDGDGQKGSVELYRMIEK